MSIIISILITALVIALVLYLGKRDFPRTLTPVISTDRLGVGNGIWSGGCSLCEVEG